MNSSRLGDIVGADNGENVHDVVIDGMVFESLELGPKIVTMLEDTVVVLLGREDGELVALCEDESSGSLHEDLSLFAV